VGPFLWAWHLSARPLPRRVWPPKLQRPKRQVLTDDDKERIRREEIFRDEVRPEARARGDRSLSRRRRVQRSEPRERRSECAR
jgi:hypothetical protein